MAELENLSTGDVQTVEIHGRVFVDRNDVVGVLRNEALAAFSRPLGGEHLVDIAEALAGLEAPQPGRGPGLL